MPIILQQILTTFVSFLLFHFLFGVKFFNFLTCWVMIFVLLRSWLDGSLFPALYAILINASSVLLVLFVLIYFFNLKGEIEINIY